MDVRLVVNPAAGRRAIESLRRIEALLKGRVSFTTLVTSKKGDAANFARELSDTDLIAVAGGDGTFNEVVNGILLNEKIASERNKIPVAFLPTGTTNVLAKEVGIPEDIERAVHLALTGTPKKISLGRINNHYFCLMAGIGFDGLTVFRTKSSIKKISGRGAYIISGIETLKKYSPPLIEIKTSEGTYTGYTAIVGKARCYGGHFNVTPKADLTEPMLDLCLFQGKTRRDILRFAGGVILKSHLHFKDVVYGKFSELEFASEGQVHIQTDGDYFGTLPARIDVVKDAISLIW